MKFLLFLSFTLSAVLFTESSSLAHQTPPRHVACIQRLLPVLDSVLHTTPGNLAKPGLELCLTHEISGCLRFNKVGIEPEQTNYNLTYEIFDPWGDPLYSEFIVTVQENCVLTNLKIGNRW